MKKNGAELSRVMRPWFAMTERERMLTAGIGLILLIGAAARYFYLKKQTPEAYDPPQAVQTQTADAAWSTNPGADHE